MLKNRTYIAWGLVVIVVLAAIGAFFMFQGAGKQQVAAGDPVDVAHDFYENWLNAAQSTTTNPYQAGLAQSPLLSKELRTRLADAQKSSGGVDPVLCQSTVPAKTATRVVSQSETKAEILVTASGKGASTQEADVTLLPLDGGWYINDIQCSLGEFAPAREFSFDVEGNLLKSDVKPLDGKHWYIVFEENGEKGHFAPLLFNAQSMCTALDGSTAVCNPDTFIQVAKAHVQGEMTETGATVKKLQLLK